MFQQPARGQYREFQSDDSESEREDAPTHQILPQGTRKNRWHHIQGMVFLYIPIILTKKNPNLCVFMVKNVSFGQKSV